MQVPSFTTLRVSLLLGVLLCFAGVTFQQQSHSRAWTETLNVTIFPINADGQERTQRYIDSLSNQSFHNIDQWSVREAKRHQLHIDTPFKASLGEQIHTLPPPWPVVDNAFGVLFWGLRFRWWAFRNTPDDGGGLTRIRMFVMYQSGEDDKALQHSLGMQKGLMGLVHAFSLHEQTDQNNVVIAHEILHTVGAIDKYNNIGEPLYPVGYISPKQSPLFPQYNAEIMAGRVPTSASTSFMPHTLHSVQINDYTAEEINWKN